MGVRHVETFPPIDPASGGGLLDILQLMVRVRSVLYAKEEKRGIEEKGTEASVSIHRPSSWEFS